MMRSSVGLICWQGIHMALTRVLGTACICVPALACNMRPCQ